MSNDLQARVREALEAMSESVLPPPDLAHRVRSAARRRRRLESSAMTVGIALVALAAALTVGSARHGPGRTISPNHGPRVLDLPVSGGTTGLAVRGRFLYVGGGDYPSSLLSVYDRTTGQLIRRVNVPALISTLTVGPDGMVWLTFSPDASGGGTGLWVLNADLSKRSSAGDPIAYEIDLSALLPTSPTTALVTGPGGLDELRLPAPGQPGVASLRRVSSLRMDHQFGGMAGAAPLGGGTAVLQQRDTGGSRIVLAGTGTEYQPRGVDIVAMLGQAGGLWVATGPQSSAGPPDGGLIRLGPRLQVQTPYVIATYPAFRSITGLLVHGDTVWVSTAARTPQLFCFRFTPGKGAGPITFVPTSPPRNAVAATADTVYVVDATSITSLPVPLACR